MHPVAAITDDARGKDRLKLRFAGLQVARVRAVAGQVGPHPTKLVLLAHEKAFAGRRSSQLRRTYSRRVADPPGSATVRPAPVVLARAPDLPAQLHGPAERIRSEANRILRHEVDYLGSGPVQLGPAIDWHRDFRSGYRWPCAFYQDVEVTRLDDPSDAKVPWELSRGHQLLTLARAARLYQDECFASELEGQLSSWLEQNPPGRGINWVNAMEIAIRAVNWIWAIGTLEGFRPMAPELRTSVTRALQAHGRHIANNLEGSRRLRNNHYVGDLLGLLVLGACIEGDPLAVKWFRFAQRKLDRQIIEQVLPDGVSFEASLPYHGLALEMFLLGWHLSAWAGQPLSPRYRARLVSMLEVLRAVRHPGGRIPVIGDQDSGRVLPGGFSRPPTGDHLLDLGSALLSLDRLIDSGPVHEEVAWSLGVDAWLRLSQVEQATQAPKTAFTAGGVYILRNRDVHLVTRWGDVGQRGVGGHGHTDLSSFELSHGVPFVLDPGTYVYTADVRARAAFRSAPAHNIVVVDGLEMHSISPERPFTMPSRARFWVEAWWESDDAIVVAGSHDGYSRSGSPVTCRRMIKLLKETSVVEIVDEVTGKGSRRVESYLHLAPEATVERVCAAALRVRCSARQLDVEFIGADEVILADGWISPSYGVRESAPVIRAVAEAELPMRLGYRMVPA